MLDRRSCMGSRDRPSGTAGGRDLHGLNMASTPFLVRVFKVLVA